MFSSIRCWVKRNSAMIQALFHIFIIISANANCFHFDKPITSPIYVMTEKKDSGKKDIPFDGKDLEVTWASDFQVVDKPLDKVLELLSDHNNTKSPKIEEMEVKTTTSKDNWLVHSVHFLTKPFLFVTIEWTENWGFYKNKPKAPTEALISYEKVEGTRHIRHMCGNIFLKKIADGKTLVKLYEEANATQRTVEDTAHGLEGTLKTIREGTL